MRLHRYGDPTYVPAKRGPSIDLTGQRFGHLTVQRYDQHSKRWICDCECGTTCARRTGELNRSADHSCGSTQKHRRRDNSGYTAAHDRVRADRGTAQEHRCAAPGCRNQAHHWAYDHSDPRQSVDPTCGPFSLDTSRYRALCVPCHKRVDLARLGECPGQLSLWPTAE